MDYLLCYVDLNKMALDDSVYDNGIDAYGQKCIEPENQSVTFLVQSFGYFGSVKYEKLTNSRAEIVLHCVYYHLLCK